MGFKWGQELLKANNLIKQLEESLKESDKENDRLDFKCYDLEQENKALKQEIKELKKENDYNVEKTGFSCGDCGTSFKDSANWFAFYDGTMDCPNCVLSNYENYCFKFIDDEKALKDFLKQLLNLYNSENIYNRDYRLGRCIELVEDKLERF
jgi:hypothetical protein